MNAPGFCRLCLNIGLDFKSLYDEQGQATDVYELTAKYFDQTILNIDEAKHLSMICLQCWEHIWDFNNFQQAVLMAQSNLDAVRGLEIVTANIEQVNANATQNIADNVQSVINTNQNNNEEDCICLSESDDEPELSILEQKEFIASEVVLEKPNRNFENVDLTFDVDDVNDEVAEGSTNAYSIEKSEQHIGGFFTSTKHKDTTATTTTTTTTDIELIEVQSDSNPSVNDDNYSTMLAGCQTYTENHNYTAPSVSNGTKRTNKQFTSFQCGLCYTKYFDYIKFLEHFNRSHTSKIAQGICCNLRLTGLSAIAHHLTSHQDDKILKCIVCGKRYQLAHYLRRHMLAKHPEAAPTKL